jgi:Fur family transcriptional regulator, ferric uptake regulator
MKKTKARQAIMEALASAKAPLSAAAIYDALGVSADQATVYRNLHLLEDEGLAESFILHCADHGTERYYTAAADPAEGEHSHRHWFHCEKCHSFTDLGSCKICDLVSAYENEYGISVRSHTLYLTGLCAKCR